MTLWKRMLAEKRAMIAPLAVAAIVNAALYAFIVYPLGVRSATASDRAAAASETLKSAEADYARARMLVDGKARADKELTTFYETVLPPDIPAARRLTSTLLPTLARKSNVKFLERRAEQEPIARDARFGRLHIRVTLTGDYESFRQFLYQLETSAEFIIIDTVALAQNDPNKPLTFTVELSTYYRLTGNGS